MNAILQCIAHTPLLNNYFRSGIYQYHVNREKKNSQEVFADVLAEFIKEYSENEATSSLKTLKSAIGKYIPQFQGYDQHDAQEFMAMLLDKLNEELTTILPLSGGVQVKTSSSGFEIPKGSPKKGDNAEDKKGEETEQKVSVMDDLFRGELSTAINCPNCGKLPEKKEHFYYLSVPLPEEVN